MRDTEQLPPTILVIFGATGDLTWRMLAPVLFDLSCDSLLPKQFAIVGVGRSRFSDAKFRSRLKSGIARFSNSKLSRKTWTPFAGQISYVQGDLLAENTYKNLVRTIGDLEKAWKTKAQRVFYLATPPAMFVEIPPRLAHAGLAKDPQHARLVIEKPFGHDLESAMSLDRLLTEHFTERQLFRIDHYLGKETVRNILVLRFANPMFEPIWNRRYIDHVTITASETLGVENRGGYYEKAGALRDMLQNHLMQLFCLIAMEPMVSFEADEIRNKKVDVLHAVRPLSVADIHEFAVRGQYGAGRIQERRTRSYREEKGVSSDSPVETFAALKLFVDNWRWQGVPFYLRTGKRLARECSEVNVHFRAVPHRAFPSEAILDWRPARLTLSIQPEEGILLRFQAKEPGTKMQLRPVHMRFNYRETFKKPSPDAYQTLLADVMRNDPTSFMRADEIEAAWRLLIPVLDAWAGSPPGGFPNYAAGTWGPRDADRLLAREGHTWETPLLPSVLK